MHVTEVGCSDTQKYAEKLVNMQKGFLPLKRLIILTHDFREGRNPDSLGDESEDFQPHSVIEWNAFLYTG